MKKNEESRGVESPLFDLILYTTGQTFFGEIEK